jgi:hypothetical protein
MEKIIKKDGYVYAYDANDKKGFETFYNMGKDPDDPRWNEGEVLQSVPKDGIVDVVPKKGKTNKKADEK